MYVALSRAKRLSGLLIVNYPKSLRQLRQYVRTSAEALNCYKTVLGQVSLSSVHTQCTSTVHLVHLKG